MGEDASLEPGAETEIPEATVQAGPAMQRLPWSGCFASSGLGLVAPTPGQR